MKLISLRISIDLSTQRLVYVINGYGYIIYNYEILSIGTRKSVLICHIQFLKLNMLVSLPIQENIRCLNSIL
jgi:hypothetical protein